MTAVLVVGGLAGFVALHLVHAVMFGLHREWGGVFRPFDRAWWSPVLTWDFWN